MKKSEASAPASASLCERPSKGSIEQQRKAAKILFDKGFGYKLVAKVLSLSPNTVRDWRREYKRGVFSDQPSTMRCRYSQKVKERVRELRAQGLSWQQISAETGVNVSTCRSWV